MLCLGGALLLVLLTGCAQAPTTLEGRGMGLPAATAASAYEKEWTALEAARQCALADLAEKVHGVHLVGESSVSDLSFAGERAESRVAGTLVGVEFVRATYDQDAEAAEVVFRLALNGREGGVAAPFPEAEP